MKKKEEIVFETYKEKSGKISDCQEPLLGITCNGKIAIFNRKAIQQFVINKYTHVTLHRAKDSSIAWLDLTCSPEEWSMKICKSGVDMLKFNLRNFLKFCEIRFETTTYYLLYMEGKKLLVDLDKCYIQHKIREKKPGKPKPGKGNGIGMGDGDEGEEGKYKPGNNNKGVGVISSEFFDIVRRIGNILFKGTPKTIGEIVTELTIQHVDFKTVNPNTPPHTIIGNLLKEYPTKFIKNNQYWSLTPEYYKVISNG